MRCRSAVAERPEGEDNESSEGAEADEGGSAPCPEAGRKHAGHIFGGYYYSIRVARLTAQRKGVF